MRYSCLYGEGVPGDWAARVHAEAIRVAERQLAYARREGQMYSSYAAWAERLERELARLKQPHPLPIAWRGGKLITNKRTGRVHG
jgi:hypothetical protein